MMFPGLYQGSTTKIFTIHYCFPKVFLYYMKLINMKNEVDKCHFWPHAGLCTPYQKNKHPAAHTQRKSYYATWPHVCSKRDRTLHIVFRIFYCLYFKIKSINLTFGHQAMSQKKKKNLDYVLPDILRLLQAVIGGFALFMPKIKTREFRIPWGGPPGDFDMSTMLVVPSCTTVLWHASLRRTYYFRQFIGIAVFRGESVKDPSPCYVLGNEITVLLLTYKPNHLPYDVMVNDTNIRDQPLYKGMKIWLKDNGVHCQTIMVQEAWSKTYLALINRLNLSFFSNHIADDIVLYNFIFYTT